MSTQKFEKRSLLNLQTFIPMMWCDNHIISFIYYENGDLFGIKFTFLPQHMSIFRRHPRTNSKYQFNIIVNNIVFITILQTKKWHMYSASSYVGAKHKTCGYFFVTSTLSNIAMIIAAVLPVLD